MLNENFVYLGIFISFLGGLSYLVDTIKGKAKPNRVSFFIWALAPMIAFAATVKQGVGVQSLLTFIVGFNPLIILLASFINKKSYWKISKLDLVCGSLAIVGLVLWQITGTGNLAIIFSIIADGLAAVPTLTKSYSFPETENSNVYLGSGIASIITLLTIQNWKFEQFAFSLYIFVVCAILYALIKFKLGKVFAK